jgi:outer membrane protein assembly factor BamD (BamD/ComL family)
MSVLGIMSSSLLNLGVQSMQNRMQTARKEFQQLGQDLQSGNLAAAQTDFATLQQMQPQSTRSTSPISQDFSQLATDLKAGNTTAAQQDYAKIQQDFQSQGPQTQPYHHHHPHGGGSGSSSNSEIGQLFSQLGSALQSGNLSTAQQAYATLQQDI